MKIIWKIALSFLLALSISGIVSFFFVGVVKERLGGNDINEQKFLYKITPTEILDTYQEPLAKFYGDRRSLATYEEIPEEIIDALISIEDREFWEHPGINVKAITRAAYEIVKAKGELVQGGSTITQQLIKMTQLTTEKTIERKKEEAILSMVLEKNFSKKEILEMYFNEMFYGNKAYGIKDAVRTYFGQTFEEFKKEEKEIRIVKAALMAGLLKAPSAYSPYNAFVYDEEKAIKTTNRRNTVLWAMKDNGVITEEEYQKYKEMPLHVLEEANIVFEEEQFGEKELVHYTLYEAADILGISMKEVTERGYEIHTSFNPDIYEILRTEFQNDKYFPKNAKDGTKVEGAAVYLNPKNGEILAFTGGRDELTNFQGFNRAFMAKRQPGSTIKPIISYGPALESGKFEQFDKLLDEKGYSFNGYKPKNWDGGGRGLVSMQEALRMSWNIPAVYTLREVGIPYATEFALKLGIDFRNETAGLSMALGGVEEGVTPLEMADSYQAYANKGIRTPAHAIRKIFDIDGKLVYEATTSTEPVIKPSTATTMKSMLQNIVENGTATRAQISGRKIAGKTGTAQYPNSRSGNRDIWFVGYDEELLGAIWMGFDHTTPNRYLNDGSKIPTIMFRDLTSKILNYQKEIEKLPTPINLIKEPPDEEPPEITISGSETVTLTAGDEYKDAGATAEDEKDGDLTKYIVVDENVDTTTPGTYTVTYLVMDKAGNEATAIRTVIVKEFIVEEKLPVETDIPSNEKDSSGDAIINIGSFSAVYKENDKGIYISWGSYAHQKQVLYHVYKNGKIVEMVLGTSYFDFAVDDGGSYRYHVIAVDKATNEILAKTNSATVLVPEVKSPSEPTESINE